MAYHNQNPKYYDENGNTVDLDAVIKSLGTAAFKNAGEAAGDVPLLTDEGFLPFDVIPSTTIFVRDDTAETGYKVRQTLKIYPCTQAEFDAIESKQSDVIYVVRR